MTTLQDRIKILAERVGNSPTRLAEIAGVKPPSASAWLSGDTKTLRADPAWKLCEYFGVSYRWLTKGIGLQNDQNPEKIGLVASDMATAENYEHQALIRLYESLSPRAKKTVRSLMDQLAEAQAADLGQQNEGKRTATQGDAPRAGKTINVDKALSSITPTNNKNNINNK